MIDPVRFEADNYALGRLVSVALPGFALDPAVLWQETMPSGSALLALIEVMAH